MTKAEFDRKWNNYELDLDYSQYLFDNYPDGSFEDFEESMVTE